MSSNIVTPPSGGTTGQVLARTPTGGLVSWADMFNPSELYVSLSGTWFGCLSDMCNFYFHYVYQTGQIEMVMSGPSAAISYISRENGVTGSSTATYYCLFTYKGQTTSQNLYAPVLVALDASGRLQQINGRWPFEVEKTTDWRAYVSGGQILYVIDRYKGLNADS